MFVMFMFIRTSTVSGSNDLLFATLFLFLAFAPRSSCASSSVLFFFFFFVAPFSSSFVHLSSSSGSKLFIKQIATFRLHILSSLPFRPVGSKDDSQEPKGTIKSQAPGTLLIRTGVL